MVSFAKITFSDVTEAYPEGGRVSEQRSSNLEPCLSGHGSEL